MFFVISGFLIIGMMYTEARRKDRIAVAAFYGRRARQILPAAMLVILAVVVFSKLAMNPIASADIGREAIWSVFFGMNVLLMVRGSDYFAQYDSVSPLQHYWSLGVEEQFYIFLPVVFLLGLLLASRRHRLRGVVVLVGLITVGSLAWSIWLSAHGSSSVAYFSSLARAWQIGAGGLLAIAFAEGRIRLGRRTAGLVGVAGLIMLGLAFVLVRGEGYPGIQALLPIAGAVAVIASGTAARDGFTQKFLSLRLLTLVGLISFSVYLWHWPVIIFTVRLWPSFEASPAHIPVMLAVTLALSVLSYAFVERPFRRLSWYRFAARSPHAVWMRRLATPAAFVFPAAVIAAIALGAPGMIRRESGADRPGAISTVAERQWTHEVRQGLELDRVPANLQPPLADVPGDMEPMECLSIDRTNMARCGWGSPRADRSVVVLGDSHAHMWFTALRHVFPPGRYRVWPLTKASCSNAEIDRREPGLPDLAAACREHRSWVRQQIEKLRPDVVVMSDFAGFTDWIAADGTPRNEGMRPAWRAGLAESLGRLAPLVPRIILIGQTPEGKALADCLPRDLTLDNCQGSDSYMAGQREIERELVEAVGGTFIDPGPWLCAGGRCPPVIAGTAVFHDDNHLTVAMERRLAPLLAAKIRAEDPG